MFCVLLTVFSEVSAASLACAAASFASSLAIFRSIFADRSLKNWVMRSVMIVSSIIHTGPDGPPGDMSSVMGGNSTYLRERDVQDGDDEN